MVIEARVVSPVASSSYLTTISQFRSKLPPAIYNGGEVFEYRALTIGTDYVRRRNGVPVGCGPGGQMNKAF